MLTALRCLTESGGLAAACGDSVIASLPLPIGGLMSDLDAQALSAAHSEVSKAAEALGTAMPQPFMAMSFLSLSVIPELKLTDQGYVNPAAGRLGLFVD
jgi:adenine deaminase